MAHIVSTLRSGRSNTETIEHGTIIEFSQDTPDIGGRDMLLLTSPAGASLHLTPAGEREQGGTYVMFSVRPTMTFKGWLERVEGNRWRFQLEPHHLAIIDRLNAAV